MRSLIILVLCSTANWLSAQELSHKQYTVKDGLPGSIVYHCLQDREGFLWFATNQGVSRFDGSTFTNFTREDGLPDNEILKLYQDRYGHLWFISLRGIPSVLYKGKIRTIENCHGVIAILEDMLTDSIFLISLFDRGETQAAGYYQSVNAPGQWDFTPHMRMIRDSSSLNKWPVLKGSSPRGINFYFSGKDRATGEILIKTSSVEKTYTVKRTSYANIAPFIRQYFSTLSGDGKGFLFYTGDSVYYSDLNAMRSIISLKELGLNLSRDGDISSLFCEGDSTLWLTTRSRGLIRICHYLSGARTIRYFFTDSYCTSIIKDREGCYWITTHSDGVYYLPNLDFHYLSGQRELAARDVKCIRALDRQRLGAGFADGNIMEINCSDLGIRNYPKWTAQNKNNRVLDIAPYTGGRTLVGSDGGAYILSPGQSWSKAGGLMAIKGIYPGPDAILALGTASGVQLVDVHHKTEKNIYPFRVTCIAGRGDHYYWGTLNGLREFSGDVVLDMGRQFPALSGAINHIDFAPDSSLWVSTQDGIVILRNGISHLLKKAQGLQGNTCKHILFDGGTAWVSTDKGISRIDYHWKGPRLICSVSGITEEDGLNSNEVNQTAVGGKFIWAATARGICYFSRDYISHSFSPPVININRVVAGDKELDPSDTVRLDAEKKRLFIELSGISFRSGRQVYYEYRLHGLDSNWTRLENKLLEFSALPFGEFVFEVRAIDRWNERSPVSRKIVIFHPPPFWRTGWFTILTYIATAFLIGILFYMFHRDKHRKKEEEYRLKKKMNDLEMMALRTQMDPHFIFNCLSSIQHYILKADGANANRYLHKFSVLVRKILQRSPASAISLSEETDMLQLYLELEKMRLGDRMEYRLDISGDLRSGELYIPSMIVQPYVENAIRHGISPLQEKKGILRVGFYRSENMIECIIEDNGIGINRSRESKNTAPSDHISMGTGNTQSRIDIFNEINEHKIRLTVLDKEGADPLTTGTIVHLSFPVSIH